MLEIIQLNCRAQQAHGIIKEQNREGNSFLANLQFINHWKPMFNPRVKGNLVYFFMQSLLECDCNRRKNGKPLSEHFHSISEW